MYCYTHLEDYIQNLYLSIGITKLKQLNLVTISKRLKFRVIYAPIKSMRNGNVIWIDNRIPVEQQWQEFGHELCHVLLHSGNQLGVSTSFREYQEWKANGFAYHLCIPTFMLDQITLEQDYYKAIEQIQALFKVEEDFAKKRLIQYVERRKFVASVV
ncbi:ImmA/IrrE family metallo-endopeptidase [Viridibacillus sp. NPDC096237]|uniref:ImmA/IrrE family metallo-endopeptidase n=1 Tax=Viridibacillus sp. NPDC096237 TaxID=3390721 RepID=UPI003CFC9FBD